MSETSSFTSRKGKLSCSPQEFYDFTTDIRNLSQFIPEGTISELHIEKESCSFTVSPLGNVTLNLSKKEPFSIVEFAGTLFNSNDFNLIMTIGESHDRKADVAIGLTASLNPILKMMVTPHVGRFLETLVNEMEKFRGWTKSN